MKKKVFSIIKVVSLLGFFIAIGSMASIFIIIFFAPSREEVIVPNVIGKDFAAAFVILSANKLDIKKASEHHDTFPKDLVISQTPSPGRKVKEGRRIRLVVSSGQEVFEMPDLRNYTVQEAQERLFKIYKGLRIEIVSFTRTNFPKDCIITQAPLPTEKIKKGELVSVLVSQGPWPKSFLMPEFIGRRWQYVNREVERLGLIIEDMVEKVDNNLEEGIVLEQNPPFGFKVRKGERVDLVISKHEEIESTYKIICYSVPRGIYEKEVRIIAIDRMGEREVYNKKEKPGEEVVISTQVSLPAKVRIYLEGILVEEREIDD